MKVTSTHPCFSDKSTNVSWPGYFGDDRALSKSPLVGISAPFGVLFIDLDTYKGVSTQDVDDALGCDLDWDQAFLQSTPRGGQHYAFRLDQAKIGKLASKTNAAGITGLDLRLPNRSFICTGKGYRLSPMYRSPDVGPSYRDVVWAIENVNWPDLPIAAYRKLLPDASKKVASQANNPASSLPPFTHSNYNTTRGIPVAAIPTAHGQRNACLLRLARWFAGRTGGKADEAEQRDVVARWYAESVANIRTKDFDVSVKEFMYAYARVKNPIKDSFEEAVAGWESQHVPRWARKYTGHYLTAILVSLKLQKFHGDVPFHLGCRTFAEVIGTSHVTAANVLKTLANSGVLKITMKGYYAVKKARRATEYLLESIAGFRYLRKDDVQGESVSLGGRVAVTTHAVPHGSTVVSAIEGVDSG